MPKGVISAAVTVALIIGAALLAGAPVWVAVLVAAAFAVALGSRAWWDYRHGNRWF